MKFQILDREERMPSNGINIVYLRIDRWNDYSFVTMFYMSFMDKNGNVKDVGNIKIGFKGQTTDIATYQKIQNDFKSKIFTSLSNDYFSIGTDADYYKNIFSLEKEVRDDILFSLKDLAFNSNLIKKIEEEDVFSVSLLRFVRLKSITEQFSRILAGKPALTDFKFTFVISKGEKNSEIKLDFTIKASSKPSSNIHAIIGRNGVGKTTILNGMVEAIMSKQNTNKRFYTDYSNFFKNEIEDGYFGSLVSVSFSAFDTFQPPKEQSNKSLGICYFYIGLKKPDSQYKIKSVEDIYEEFTRYLAFCMSEKNRKKRWIDAIRNLESDENFANMEIPEKLAIDLAESKLKEEASGLIRKMSSGHAIVLLIITKLVAITEEKTLILLDEPESHLHPPLLSAFIRALSDLLYDQNGIAIVATHSPVVLQEIPRLCVSKIQRVGLATNVERPSIETFGENVGVLTREVFGLEVVKSGFHKLLTKSVAEGQTYEEIIRSYNEQLGMEAKVLLKLLINERYKNNV